MSANSRAVARAVVLAGFSACFGGALVTGANAADLGMDCCADLEERIAELEASTARGGVRASKGGPEHELKIKGAVSAGFLIWDDGGHRDTYIVGTGTDFEIEGETKFKSGWTLGATIGIDILHAPSDVVSQDDANGSGADAVFSVQNERRPPGLEIAEAVVAVEHKNLGAIQLGFQDTATDDVDNVNLSRSNDQADAGVDGWNAEFFIRAAGIPGHDGLLDVTWGDFFDGNLLGATIMAVQYISPNIRGFEFSVAWGGNDTWDTALRYAGEIRGIRIAAGIGYFVNLDEELDDIEPVEDHGWGGSIAALHVATGLNLAFNYSTMSHTDMCAVPGAVSASCRGDDHVYYLKGGLVRQFNRFGATAFYGEYYRQIKNSNESEDDVLRALELNEDTALELQNSTAEMWGFGVVQKFEDNGKNGKAKNGNGGGAADVADVFAKKSETPMEIYLGYRHYSVDVNLVNGAGGVAGKRLKDFGVVLTGLTIRF